MASHNIYKTILEEGSMDVLFSQPACTHLPKDATHCSLPALQQERLSFSLPPFQQLGDKFKIPTHDEPYTVIKELHNYAGRQVLLLRCPTDDSPIILKQTIIPIEASSSQAQHLHIEIFFIERVKQLPCPYLTEMKQLIIHKECVYNLMEYYCGGDLARYRKGWSMLSTQEKRQKVAWVRGVIRDVLMGLKRVNQMGYVFRDLKLQNVVISHEGRAKLCDFGLVAPIGCVDPSLCGTLECMPPERLNPKKRENPLHPSIDAWALGIMTYELVMGTIPYKATTRKSPEKSLLNEIYNADIIMDEYIPEEGKAFITNLLQLNPEKRMDICTALEHPFLCQGSSSGWWHCPCK